MPLAVRLRLQAELNVLPADLGLTEQEFAGRVNDWEMLAGEQQPDSARRYPAVKAYLLRSWITALSREADKFRAEGDLTVETDILGRIVLLRSDLLLAQAEAGGESSATATYGPLVGGWGVG